MKKLTGQNAALKKSTQNAADAVSQANINLNGARAAVKTTESEISKCNRSLALAQTNWDAAGKSIEQSRTAITTFGKQISLAESKFKLAAVGIKDTRAPEDAPALVKKIGKTTYKVRVHFSQTSTETMSDKIKRMLKNEIQQM